MIFEEGKEESWRRKIEEFDLFFLLFVVVFSFFREWERERDWTRTGVRLWGAVKETRRDLGERERVYLQKKSTLLFLFFLFVALSRCFPSNFLFPLPTQPPQCTSQNFKSIERERKKRNSNVGRKREKRERERVREKKLKKKLKKTIFSPFSQCYSWPPLFHKNSFFFRSRLSHT